MDHYFWSELHQTPCPTRTRLVSSPNRSHLWLLQEEATDHCTLAGQVFISLILVVWQRFCEPARLRIAYCPWVRVFSVSCPPPQIVKNSTSELAICV